MKSVVLQNQDSAVEPVLYMALELSQKSWKVVFSAGKRQRRAEVKGGDQQALGEAIVEAKEKLGLGPQTKVVSCYEAGRDGFWLHRYLLSCGVENLVVDSSSIETNRRKRRAKTDRLDAQKLLTMLIRYFGGERGLWQVVKVPSLEDEEARRTHRELEALRKERTRHRNRMGGLLITQNIRLKPGKDFLKALEKEKLWDGGDLPMDLKGEVEREYARLKLVEQQILAMEKLRRERLATAQTERLVLIGRLMELRGIGLKCAWLLVMEFFGWRRFKNRREVGACAGLTGTPYESGNSRRDQGISKAGNWRVRAMMVEIGWLWLRYQPNSALSRWFEERFAQNGRNKRVGIVAVARKLLVALWQYLEHGVMPEGAEFKAA